MLGRLARWLRILGYDTKYVTGENRFNSILESLHENRIILTRDRHLSANRAWKLLLIEHGHFAQQLLQLTRELGLAVSRKQLFSRCAACNTPIEPVVNKADVRQLVPQYVYETAGDFSRCPACNRIYWHGTHRALLLADLEKAGIKINE